MNTQISNRKKQFELIAKTFYGLEEILAKENKNYRR